MSRILSAMTNAVKNFVNVPGQSVMRQIAGVGAKEAGVKNVYTGTFNGQYHGSFFEILTGESKEFHWIIKKSAKIEYHITVVPNDVLKKGSCRLVFSLQMPQVGDGGASSSKKK